MIYQLRDIFGNKLLERESAAEVAYFLRGHASPAPCEVWILQDRPGRLVDVVPADQFITTPTTTTQPQHDKDY